MATDPSPSVRAAAPAPPGATERSRVLRMALFGLMAVAIGVLAVLLHELRAELKSYREGPVDNVHWNVTQLELDLVRLQSAADLARLRADTPLDDVRLKYDLFYSRTGMLSSGAMFLRLDPDPEVKDRIAQLDAFLRHTTPLIDGGDPALRAALPELSATMNELRLGLRTLAIELVGRHAAQADVQRVRLVRLLEQIVWATGALLALMVGLLTSVSYLHRQAELQTEAVTRVSSRLQATVGTALDAVVVAGMDGRVLDFNAAAERIFGYTRDEALGRELDSLIVPPRHIAAHRAGMARMAATRQKKVVDAGRIQITAVRKSGEEFPVELSIASNSGPEGMIFISYLRDISQPLADEKALLAARDKALAAEQAKTNFMAVMSHEMRTPLNGVMAALEIAARRTVDARQARFLDIARASAEQLLRHVNDVLDISRVEAGHLALSEEPFELVPMIATLVEALRPAAAERGTRIELRALSDLPPVSGDAFRLGQVVQNLLSNAIKFTENGLVSVEVELQERRLGVVTVELRVTDTGIGIAAEDLDRVFEDFVMLDPSYAREGGGTGLGLAISRRLTEAMGGTIGVESEPGEGSCFWLRLPLRIAARPVSAPARPQPATGVLDRHGTVPGLDLLVVEDNATNRTVLEELLGAQGHRVTLAADGAEGVARAAARRFDAILMDISMPVMDGLTATRLIRAEGLSKESRIIAITAHTMPDELERFRAAGMDDCLTKPMSGADLARALATGPAEPGPAPAAGAVLDAARLDELHVALGAAGLGRTTARFLADTRAALESLGQGAPQPEALARCHEIAGAAAMIGAEGLRRHFAQIETNLRAGAAAVDAAELDRARRLLAETEAALAGSTE